jgi:hypothetical protein
MDETSGSKGSWWQTLPGILTATAGLLTAIAGLVVALSQVGLLAGGKPAPQSRIEPKPPPLEATGAPSALPREPSGKEAGAPPPPSGEATRPAAQPETLRNLKGMNLLSPEDGGQLVLAPNDAWSVTIDGKEDAFREVQVGEEAVFAFKDERAATFDSFSMLIPRSGRNPKQFELFVADSPTGPFRSLGTFQPQNVRLMKTAGWQEFKFPPVTAKYLKVKLRSNYEDVVWIDLFEFRLSGQLQ